MVVDYRAIEPLSLSATIEKLKPLEAFLKQIPEIDFYIRKTGTALGEYDKPPYLGEIIIILKKNRAMSVFELRDKIAAETEKLVPGFEFDLFQILPDRLNDLSGTAKPIVLYLHGSDEEKMDKAAVAVKKAFSSVKGLESVRIEEPEKTEQLLYSINEARARALNLSPASVDENARLALFSLDSSSVQIGPQLVPIRLRLKTDNISKNGLAGLPIYSTRGGLEKLSALGQIESVKGRVGATHIDGAPVRTLTAEIAGRDLGSVVSDIQTMLGKLELNGVYPVLAGEYATQQSSFRELILAFLSGLALIFITSLLFSNRVSIALPMTVAAAIPPVFGLCGCVFLGIPLDVSSFSGLISVTGIAVANGFMAISAIEDLGKNCDPAAPLDNVVLGMMSRIRPILMTNLAAMAGFVPIAAGFSKGDEILRPFSIAIIVGLVGAMFTTLIVIPVFYLRFSQPLEPFADELELNKESAI